MHNQLKTVLTIVAILIIVGGIFAWFQSNTNPDSADSVLDIDVRLKWLISGGNAGLVTALQNGYFSDAGLGVSIHEGGPEIDPIKQVVSGQDEIALVGADRLLLARAQGIPVQAFALESQYSFVVFTALAKSGIDNPEDFKGHTIGTQQDDTYTIFNALLNKFGIDKSEINERPVGFDLSPLLEGVVDVYPSYVINQPIALRNMGVNINIIKPWEYGIEFSGNVYIAREDFLREYPEAAKSFVKALREGWDYSRTHRDESIAMVKIYNNGLVEKDERELLDEFLKHIDNQDRQMLDVSPEDLRQTYEIMRAQGILTEDLNLNSAVFEID